MAEVRIGASTKSSLIRLLLFGRMRRATVVKPFWVPPTAGNISLEDMLVSEYKEGPMAFALRVAKRTTWMCTWKPVSSHRECVISFGLENHHLGTLLLLTIEVIGLDVEKDDQSMKEMGVQHHSV